jgi:uncharacterized membrane protein YqjE
MPETASPTLPGILRRCAVTLLGVLHTRLSLAGLELAEEIERLIAMLVTALAMVLFATLALLVFSLLVVLACGEQYRLLALCILALVYAVVAFFFWRKLNHDLKERPPMFAATLAELENDRAALREGGAEDATLTRDTTPP